MYFEVGKKYVLRKEIKFNYPLINKTDFGFLSIPRKLLKIEKCEKYQC